MKTVKLVIACVVSVVFLGLAGVAGAQNVVEVWPTGNPNPFFTTHPWYFGLPCTEDLANVQQAVLDAGPGGSVLLHARDINGVETAFDFGSFPPLLAFYHCFLFYSITIKGEEGGDPMTGEGMTKIVNGQWPFVIFEVFPPADVEIRNIHFQDPYFGAIAALKCQDFTAMKNRITADTMSGKTNPMTNMGVGIVVQGSDPPPSDPVPENIYGQVVIQDNYVDLEQDGLTPTSWETYSVIVADTVADVDIRGNHCLNDTINGISLFDNYGVMLVKNNYVELGETPEDALSAHCIIVFQTKDTDLEATGNAYVLNNTGVCNGEKQIGIELGNFDFAAELDFSSVKKNHITLHEGLIGIALSGQDNAYIGQNKLEGESLFGITAISGIELGGLVIEFGPAHDNVLVGNNISNLETGECDVFLTKELTTMSLWVEAVLSLIWEPTTKSKEAIGHCQENM